MREFLKSKLHGGLITKADLDYEGSLGIDAALMRAAGILPFESVEVYNVTNGHRLRTYAIELPAESGRLESNGAAAHWMRRGDQIIIATYSWIEERETATWKPKVVILNHENRIKTTFEGSTHYSHRRDTESTDSNRHPSQSPIG